jgi:hypothetical protein
MATTARNQARAILQPHHLQQAFQQLSTSALRAGPWPPTLEQALQHSLYGPLTRIQARSLALKELQQQRATLLAALPHITHDARGKAAHHHDD